ncbi:hypothetical protein HYFRA_00006669 [Hymenoscyphus fraxineus]|uniref:Uncharacterized protein n=1 Tax=Hymenoscyphus fraxineus TaxID=746836 RepID=A0A9N9KVS6_9HELO|nr:hypothetical protein HYFRA_00006669 [Hymenoscyphus fraxineus]
MSLWTQACLSGCQAIQVMEKLQKWVAESHIDLQQDPQTDHVPLPELVLPFQEQTHTGQVVIEHEHPQQVTVGIPEVGIVLQDEDPGRLLAVTVHHPETIGEQEQDPLHVQEVPQEDSPQDEMMTAEQDHHPGGMIGMKGIYTSLDYNIPY